MTLFWSCFFYPVDQKPLNYLHLCTLLSSSALHRKSFGISLKRLNLYLIFIFLNLTNPAWGKTNCSLFQLNPLRTFDSGKFFDHSQSPIELKDLVGKSLSLEMALGFIFQKLPPEKKEMLEQKVRNYLDTDQVEIKEVTPWIRPLYRSQRPTQLISTPTFKMPRNFVNKHKGKAPLPSYIVHWWTDPIKSEKQAYLRIKWAIDIVIRLELKKINQTFFSSFRHFEPTTRVLFEQVMLQLTSVNPNIKVKKRGPVTEITSVLFRLFGKVLFPMDNDYQKYGIQLNQRHLDIYQTEGKQGLYEYVKATSGVVRAIEAAIISPIKAIYMATALSILLVAPHLYQTHQFYKPYMTWIGEVTREESSWIDQSFKIMRSSPEDVSQELKAMTKTRISKEDRDDILKITQEFEELHQKSD